MVKDRITILQQRLFNMDIKHGQMLALTLKQVLECLIVAICIVWVGWWLVSTEPIGSKKYVDELQKYVKSRFFRTDGREGMIFMYQTIPFVLLVVLSLLVIKLRKMAGATKRRHASSKSNNESNVRSKLSTYPLFVNVPLMGVLTIMEAISIAMVLFIVYYHFSRMIHLAYIDKSPQHMHGPHISKNWYKVRQASYYLATASLVPFTLLWIPISRGSPLLRLMRIPFEHAVKYHIWLAVLMMFLLTLHSIGYIMVYIVGHEAHQIIEWASINEKCSMVAGLVDLILGLVMWATSLSFFRRRWYELFFGLHHLYIPFVLFWLYHAVWSYHYFIIPVLLFTIDRFLRKIQSWRVVDVLSAKILESGAVELRIARNHGDGLEDHALSSWYIRLPSLSRFCKLQWHFFSVTSSPLDELKALTIIIKPLGGWTKSLRRQLEDSIDRLQQQKQQLQGANVNSNLSSRQYNYCPFSFKAAVEGPYGDESDFYLGYRSLILVGGGIGVTPLLAIMRDILHRHRIIRSKLGQDQFENYTDLPTSIKLYHCVRTPEELCVLNNMNPEEIFPDYKKLTNLDIQVEVYMTTPAHYINNMDQTENKDSTMKRRREPYNGAALGSYIEQASHALLLEPAVIRGGELLRGVSGISASSSMQTWVGSMIFVSMVGYLLLSGLLNVLVVGPYSAGDNFPNFNRAHVVAASVLLSTCVLGGAVVLAWRRALSSSTTHHAAGQVTASSNTAANSARVMSVSATPSPALYRDVEAHDNVVATSITTPNWDGFLHFGGRPTWPDVFHELAKEYAGQNVGVLVSGSKSMQQDIARECRRHSPLFYTKTSSVAFHYHSISFEL